MLTAMSPKLLGHSLGDDAWSGWLRVLCYHYGPAYLGPGGIVQLDGCLCKTYTCVHIGNCLHCTTHPPVESEAGTGGWMSDSALALKGSPWR